MLEDSALLDRVYGALASPVRRSLLVALRAGEARISDLAEPFDLTFAGVSRHIGVLENAGLVTHDRRGREHWVTLRPEGLVAADRWLDEQCAFWSKTADALAARMERKKRSR